MNQFLKKINALAYIYLVLSVPAINASRVKRHDVAAAVAQDLVQEAKQAMEEINQIGHEETTQWGWATCAEREEQFTSRQKEMQAGYEKAMEDGKVSGMEAGRVAVKLYAVSSTLSKASKSGCEWVTDHSADTSPMQKTFATAKKHHPCQDAVQDYLEKAKADGVSANEANANAFAILLSMDCKLPSAKPDQVSEASPFHQKPLDELVVEEETAETGAAHELQEFQDRLADGNQTSLLQLSREVGPDDRAGQTAIAASVGFLLLVYAFPVLLEILIAMAICVATTWALAAFLTFLFIMLKKVFKMLLGVPGASFEFRKEWTGAIESKEFVGIVGLGCIGQMHGLAVNYGIAGAAGVGATNKEVDWFKGMTEKQQR